VRWRSGRATGPRHRKRGGGGRRNGDVVEEAGRDTVVEEGRLRPEIGGDLRGGGGDGVKERSRPLAVGREPRSALGGSRDCGCDDSELPPRRSCWAE
jgi:hypothetical protein